MPHYWCIHEKNLEHWAESHPFPNFESVSVDLGIFLGLSIFVYNLKNFVDIFTYKFQKFDYILLDFLCTQLCCPWIVTVVFLLFQFLSLVFSPSHYFTTQTFSIIVIIDIFVTYRSQWEDVHILRLIILFVLDCLQLLLLDYFSSLLLFLCWINFF